MVRRVLRARRLHAGRVAARSSQAGRAAGLKLRIHADEFGAERRIATSPPTLRARSADHLIFVDKAGADGLAAAGVVATLLPIASFYLKLGRFAPARMLIDRGVAGRARDRRQPRRRLLAVDAVRDDARLLRHEPDVRGSAGRARRSTPRTSLDRHDRVGSLEPGKQMDAVIVDGPAIDLIRVGADDDPRGGQEGTRRRSTGRDACRSLTSRFDDCSPRSAPPIRRPAADRRRRSRRRSARRC